MAKKRAAGAARPYPYTATYTNTTKDGQKHTRKVQRWKIQLDLGKGADGRRRRKTFIGKTSAEAKAKCDQARREMASGAEIRTDARKPTLGDYCQLFLSGAKQRVAPKTYDLYATIINRHLLDTEKAADITRILSSGIQRILDRARNKGLSLCFRHSMWACLNQTFDLALADRIIQANPVKSVKLKSMSTVDTGRRAYSIAELRSILYTTLNQPIQQSAIWWWHLLTGMRQAEILGTELNHLHLDTPNPHYELTDSLAEIPREHGCGTATNGHQPCGHAKGGLCPQAKWRIPDGFTMRPLQGRFCIKTPKSGCSRMVPIVPQLAEVMSHYLHATKDVPNLHGLIFRNPDGSPRIWKQDEREFKELLAESGIDPDGHTGHETRYSAVALMRRAGNDQKAIEEIIGHTSVKVDNICTTVNARMSQDAAVAITDALNMPGGALPCADTER